MEYIKKLKSPVGPLTVSSDGEKITGLWIERQKYFGYTLEKENAEKELPVFDKAKEWLDIYFNGKIPEFIPPLAPKGSEFRKKVWDILINIPYGKTVSYRDIAKAVGGRAGMSAQAVGGAVGHNPISIIIPCHRVVGADGSLTGYAAGIDVKQKLLLMESADLSGFKYP